MRKESWSIAITCFVWGVLGVFVGVKTALLFGLAPYTAPWFLAGFAGALAGSIGAYLFYDLPAVFAAMKRAWHELADTKNHKRLGKAALSGLWSFALSSAAVTMLVASFFAPVYLSAVSTKAMVAPPLPFIPFTAALLPICFFGVCIFGVYSWYFVREVVVSEKMRRMLDIHRGTSFNHDMAVIALTMNPVVMAANMLIFAGFLVFLVGYGLWWLAKRIPDVVMFLAWLAWRTPKAFWRIAVFFAIFAYRVLILIHSEIRTICAVDTFLGVMAAYALVPAETPEQMLVAMLAGGVLGLIFGVLNFEFVSVRWLHLVPARANAKK